MMRRALIPLVLPLAALADDPFACVDPDVADAFVGGWYESVAPGDYHSGHSSVSLATMTSN